MAFHRFQGEYFYDDAKYQEAVRTWAANDTAARAALPEVLRLLVPADVKMTARTGEVGYGNEAHDAVTGVTFERGEYRVFLYVRPHGARGIVAEIGHYRPARFYRKQGRWPAEEILKAVIGDLDHQARRDQHERDVQTREQRLNDLFDRELKPLRPGTYRPSPFREDKALYDGRDEIEHGAKGDTFTLKFNNLTVEEAKRLLVTFREITKETADAR